MDNSDHTVIDFKNLLATSLRTDLAKLNPLTDECCIYKVPHSIRRLNEALFAPKAISIGPLHHGREELKAMEEHKKRYLLDFLNWTKLRLEDLIEYIKKRETRLRNSYAETIWLGSDEFVKIILVDAVFVLELLLRNVHGHEREFHDSDYRIFTKPCMVKDIMWFDMLLVENQLPMFILKDLFELAKAEHMAPYAGTSLAKLTRESCAILGTIFLIEDNLLEEKFPEAEHFLDLIGLCLRPLELGEQKKLKTLNTPSITELHQAGVKFETGSSKHLLDIRFKNGILEMPNLKVNLATERFFRNLQVFEIMHYDINYMNDYITIMNYLFNAPKDVELLVQKGIIQNWLWDSEAMSTFFHNLLKESWLDYNNFYYADLIEDLNAYCRSPWHNWKASLKQNYFNTPWASISVIAAVILLLLTFIQTYFSAVKQ